MRTETRDYIIICGKDVSLHEFNCKAKAIEYCQNHLDQSNEIILRRCDMFTDHTKTYINNNKTIFNTN